MTRGVVRRFGTGLVGAIIVVLCFRYIHLNFRWDKILQVLSGVQLAWWPIVVVSIMAYWMLRTLRWFVLLRNTQERISLLDLYFSTSVSLSLAIITPLQSGEMLKVEFMNQRSQLDRSSGYGSFLIERVMDLVVLASLATISVLSSANLSLKIDRKSMAFGALALALLVLVGCLVVAKTRLPGRIGNFFSQARASAGNPTTLLLVLLLTLLSWAVVVIGWQMCLRSIAIHSTFRQSAALMSITSIIKLLSFVPGAIGVSEVSIARLLLHWQQDVGSAQAGALILRCYGLAILLLGLAHYVAAKVSMPAHTLK